MKRKEFNCTKAKKEKGTKIAAGLCAFEQQLGAAKEEL